MDFVPPQRILSGPEYASLIFWLLLRTLPFLAALILIISKNKYGFLLGAADQLWHISYISQWVHRDVWLQLLPPLLLLIVWIAGFLWWHLKEPKRRDPVDLFLNRPSSDE